MLTEQPHLGHVVPLDSPTSLQRPQIKASHGPRTLEPHIYSPWTGWRPSKSLSRQKSLVQGELLKVVSWNAYYNGSDLENRTEAAVNHLKGILGDPPPPTVIILQGLHHQSLSAILTQSWIRKNFISSNAVAPKLCFTLMLVSRGIKAENWFRVPFPNRTERDALVVDIPISSLGVGSSHLKKRTRHRTTHHDQFPISEGEDPQLRDLARIFNKSPTPRANKMPETTG